MRFVAVIAGALVGCGDSGGETSASGGGSAGECSDAWCKGDPAGTWRVVVDSACLARPVEAGGCAALQCALKSAVASGSLALPAGGQGASVDALGLLAVEDAATQQQWATGSYCAGAEALEFKALALQTLPGLGLVDVQLRVRAAPV